MNQYKYETHMHTSETSACATVTGVQQARIYKKLGYTGIIVTDHFYNGNTTVPRRLPWKKWVEKFMLGYENTKKEGEKIGLSVFFGWEESFMGTDFLVYGLDKEWLMEHPEVTEWDIEEYHKNVKAAGGFFVHAHPFREEFYIPEIRLFPHAEDGIEIINSSHRDLNFDKKARKYAKQHNKPVTAGSDAHHKDCNHGGMIFDHKLKDIHDFITSVKRGTGIELFRENSSTN